MPTYTFGPAPVLIETTGEFAIGATGVLRPTGGGDPVPVTDLNDSPLPSVLVGPKGAHQAFRADIPHGVLDFGSVQIVAVSVEAIAAGIGAEASAETATSAAAEAVVAAQSVANRLGMTVIDAWDDPSTPRPNLPPGAGALWLARVTPYDVDDVLDIVFGPSGGSGGAGGTGEPVVDPNDPDAFVFAGGPLVQDPNDPDAYVF